MKFKAIIFDLDGVICTTDEYHYRAWKQMAASIGVSDFTRADSDLQRGISRMDSLEVILRKCKRTFSDEEKFALAEQKNQIYRSMLATMSERDLSKNVSSTLCALRGRGAKLAIGSSSKNAKYILERLGLGAFFDAVVDGNMISRGKPDPEVFLKAAGLLGLPPRECLVVEDAAAGIRAALAGGFQAAGLGEGAKCEGTTYRLSSFADLLAIVN